MIGRAGGGVGADIEVHDPETSRAHAAVECYGTRRAPKDLESTNGTWVAEHRVGRRNCRTTTSSASAEPASC